MRLTVPYHFYAIVFPSVRGPVATSAFLDYVIVKLTVGLWLFLGELYDFAS